jgi:hypothetical protein
VALHVCIEVVVRKYVWPVRTIRAAHDDLMHTVVARANIRTAGAAGWDRSPAYLRILACLAGSVLLHACAGRSAGQVY